ncbi:MAG: outer membrane beta-barrel domain-containing protein [Sinobacteraceae bacterium]|nr:outer membrane beta-barrel domain-containing protein [Nevskiaceae bacterium]MBV8853622.1 outer membrane beta-barrel domain-containing protein [Nevskiaceae bacterium]MBV9913121.1 outer membrane beta-barrel domain-containing protein [Nevskiaceae bacterium]
METGLRVLLLSAVLLALPGCASVRNWFHHHSEARQARAQAREEAAQRDAQEAQQDAEATPPRVIDPEVERRKIKVPHIHSSNVELGLQYGFVSIEDFGTQSTYGVSAAYHITEDFFFLGELGTAYGGRTSFETLGGNIQLLTDAERRFTYYDLSLGYNFLPGEAFIGRGIALASSFYLLGGIGSTRFGGDNRFSVNFGAGYRVLPSDWLAVHIQVQDRVFRTDLLGVSKLTNNMEATLGATVFF